MAIEILTPEDQQAVDDLRITLCQVTIDMTEVFTHDANSENKKTGVLMQLAEMRAIMDRVGIVHTMARSLKRGGPAGS